MNRTIKIVSIARMKLSDNRGTPIRVRSLLTEFAKDSRIILTVASWDAQNEIVGSSQILLLNMPFRDTLRLWRHVRQEKIDVVIGHTMATWHHLLFLKFFSSAKIVLEMHGFLEEESKLYDDISPLRYRIDKLLYSLVYRSCDFISTCSQTAAEVLLAYNPNTVAVYGGVDPDLFNPHVPPQPVPGTRKVLIGYAGNSRVWQGLPFLLGSFKDLHSQDPSIQLALLLSELKNLSLPEGVIRLDPLPHERVPEFLASCDILVIPRLENRVNRLSFPSKLMEYMAMGKPVIASKTSDMQRIIEDGVTGILYEPGDSKGFCVAVGRLNSKETRTGIGQAARTKAQNDFSWSKQADIIIQNISKLTF